MLSGKKMQIKKGDIVCKPSLLLDGFTLMEVVVMLFILSIGILSILSLARRSSYFQSVKKNLISAAYLSQEGIEVMKNIRDTNIILKNDYDNWDGISSAGVGDNTYKLDFFALLATSCPSIDEAVLSADVDGFLGHIENGEESIFRRLITVRAETTSSTTVESWVRWTERGQTYDYKLETVLYDLSL